MNKGKELRKIAIEIEKCSECKKEKRGKAVSGEGNLDARIVFIGEAPGRQEAKTGRPFIGRSGQLLRFLIREIGLKEENVFITSLVKYFPNRGTPSKSDVEHGRIHLNKQLNIINPEIVILLGGIASFGVLEEKILISKRHGEIIDRNSKKYFVTFHPSAALRFPPIKKLIIEDFQKLKLLLNKKN